MSSTVNYDDLYEEFIRLTSSPKPEQRLSEVTPVAQAVVEVIKIKYEINECLEEKSPLRVLTPPSPISFAPPPTPYQGPSSGFAFLSSSDHTEREPLGRMCDSSQGTTAPTITVISGQGSGPVPSVGKQLSVDGSSMPNNPNNGQTFITGLLPTTMIQHTQHHNNLTPVHGHGHVLGNLAMEPQHSQQQPTNAMHSPMHSHSIQGNSCSAIQYHLMDNHHHHHVQQINLSHQHGTHQVSHGPPHQATHSHHPLQHNSHNPQQFVPFGMHLNSNNVGNGSTYTNHQVNPFNVHGPQIPNQQPAHSMNMGLPLQQTCFMQHATCMHYQQNSQSLATLTPQRGSGWMNGPGSIASQNAINTNNHENSTNLATCVSVQHDGTKMIHTPKGQVPGLADPTPVPGGLDILWRELPVDCQKLMIPQDVPDSARFRGYFTVCELLVLKRALENRYVGAVKIQAGMPSNSKSKPQINKVVGVTGGRVNKGNKEQGKRGSKRTKKDDRSSRKTANASGKRRNVKGSGNYQPQEISEMLSSNDNERVENCSNEVMQEDTDENSINGEVMISLDGMKGEIHTKISPAVTGVGVGVGGVVKAAIEALTSSATTTTGQSGNGESSSQVTKENDITLLAGKDTTDTDELVLNEPSNSTLPVAVVVATNQAEEASSSQLLGDMNYSKEISTSELAVLPSLLPSMSTFSGLFPEKKDAGVEESSSLVSTSTNSNTSAGTQITGDGKDVDDASTESQKQLVLALNSITSDHAASSISSLTNTMHHINNSIAPGVGCCAPVQVPVENRYSGPPPPYRTATLVIKLLQIGAYHIRSFSAVNPNRLRVLFNTQRMTYECQLPVTQDLNSSSGSSLVRKVLTIDVGFEQISMLKFGPDSLLMRVEGAPLLTIAVNPAPEESANQCFSPQDYFLLDQIEKGQLKLSPIHQLYFLNERLVHLLESQFREHPRFRHLIVCASR